MSTPIAFANENAFEEALCNYLVQNGGWCPNILYRKTNKELIENWKNILFDINRRQDVLNNVPLTDSEMNQVLNQIRDKYPIVVNAIINGESISIIRDNPKDTENFGKPVSLRIIDTSQPNGGISRFQIARQTIIEAGNNMEHERRFDVTLLFCGIPLIHIELKNSGVDVWQAYNQIEKYYRENKFTDLFSCVQIFIAMNPDKALYFANPGPEHSFNRKFVFHWSDRNNEPVNDWQSFADSILNAPIAHEIVCKYTVADDSDGALKVLRSYQYYAASKIFDIVNKINWDTNDKRGGYIWNTTGSGKTLTSFKAAQLISALNNVDKVIFLVDRIELGTQSLSCYRAFASDAEEITETKSTDDLLKILDDSSKKIIVTSIQKLDNAFKSGSPKLQRIQNKRIVIIEDEAHRSTFGSMFTEIKKNLNNVILFGFTGTPIFEENKRNGNQTSDLFGSELERYSLRDGIIDENVLGFDLYPIETFSQDELRKAVALQEAKAASEEAALSDPQKAEVYQKYIDPSQTDIIKIEEKLPSSQYDTNAHREKVVEDIVKKWRQLSNRGKFHAIFATSSISQAIKYYELLKEKDADLKITSIFDDHDQNGGTDFEKNEGIKKILTDYNARYGTNYGIAEHAQFRKDVAQRLAHKGLYKIIDNKQNQEKALDIVIVVDQLLTGFDSKWVNTIYLDKELKYERIIQTFSRTNRIFGNDKPFGIIRYYRSPHTMKQSIEKAVELYSGGREFDIFKPKLPGNLKRMNEIYTEIKGIFEEEGITDMAALPEDETALREFSRRFGELTRTINAAKLQGFGWNHKEYIFAKDNNGELQQINSENIDPEIDQSQLVKIRVDFLKRDLDVLTMRHRELVRHASETGFNVPYELSGCLNELHGDNDTIDADYMQRKFERFIREFRSDNPEKDQEVKAELIRSFSSLTQRKQEIAKTIIRDIENGQFQYDPSKRFMEYLQEYDHQDQQKRINEVAEAFGLDPEELNKLYVEVTSEKDLNRFSRFDNLIDKVDQSKAKEFLERKQSHVLEGIQLKMGIYSYLRHFLLEKE